MKKPLSVLTALSAVGLTHCASTVAPSAETETAPAPAVAIDEGIEPAALPTDRCVAEIERPFPADPTLELGTVITLKTGGAICPIGQNDKLAYRYYVEKVDRNGNIIAERKSPQGPTEWSLTKSTFDTSVLDGPGRYRIYGFSLPRTMVAAWQANDAAARARATRTGNAYVELVTDLPGTNQISVAGGAATTLANSSGNRSELGDPMMCMMLGDCWTYDYYDVEGFWDDPSSSVYYWVRVSFAAKPTVGDYTLGGGFPPGPNQAYSLVVVGRPDNQGDDYYNNTMSSAVVKVRLGADNELHVLIDDRKAGDTANHVLDVRADLHVEP